VLTTDEITVRGSILVPKAMLSDAERMHLCRLLTLQTKPYKNFAATTVRVYEETAHYFSVPRHFMTEKYWPNARFEWVEPRLYQQFKSRMQLDHSRGQVAAVDAVEQHIRANHGGILVAGTGVGKTIMSLETARRFNTPVGVLIYAGHMIENWVRHAIEHYGLSKDEIGFVQEDRCDLGKPITLMSVQSLLSRRYPDSLYESIGFLIADEVHRYGAAQWHKTLAAFPARYRLGMSADPSRPDGLEEIVRWTFGSTAYRLHRKTKVKASVCVYRYPAVYNERRYCDFAKDENTGEWVQTDPNPMKYDKLLMGDTQRNKWIVEQVVAARRKGRCILVFSKRRPHCQALHEMFQHEVDHDPTLKGTRAALLLGGATTKKAKKANADALHVDVMFSTYGYAKDAMDAVQLDTLFFATPPGNPLQPIGRLRDINADEKQPLLVVDIYEPNPYSEERLDRRESLYRSLGHPIRRFGRDTR